MKRSIRRLGCGVLLGLWFAVMLLPCAFVVVASRQEISLTHSDIPGHALRVWLVQEARQRGIAISTSRRIDLPNERACVLTDVRFILWQGQADPTGYCECYERQNASWIATGKNAAVCGSGQ